MDLEFLQQCPNATNILFVWGTDQTANTEQNVNALKSSKEGVSVTVENIDRLSLSNHPKSSFDVVVLATSAITTEILCNILKLMKPSGKLAVVNTNLGEGNPEFKLSGFVNSKVVNGTLLWEKPAYEVGSAVKLSFAKKVDNKAEVAAIWKVDAVDEDIIDPDDLLDEEDKVKPDPASLKVCGTTGKRKACKDCSCGLAEELAAENGKKDVDTSNAKSSCGSCYLGDAFRCSSCPYLGMPAFKPGEKILLSENLLKADV